MDTDVGNIYEQVHLPEAWTREPFDVICSLGGNCSAAHNLLIRHLRACSYPFDWLFLVDGQPLQFLTKHFGGDFSDFCRLDRLEELRDVERGTDHGDRMQYKDLISGYRFVNHFSRPISDTDSSQRVRLTLQRRYERLLKHIDNSARVLFVLACSFPMDEAYLEEFAEAVSKKWPCVEFRFCMISFNADSQIMRVYGRICHFSYLRKIHSYDFLRTGYEWSFLDDVRLSTCNFPDYSPNKKKRGVVGRLKKWLCKHF